MEQITFRELMDELTALYREGKYAKALDMIEPNSSRFPDQAPRITFWKMCLLSLCNRSEAVMTVFKQGLDSGLWWAKETFIDPDLNAVRELPEFKRLMAISEERHQEARTGIQRDQTVLLPDASESDRIPLLIVLHGRNGNKESDLDYLEVACQKGWVVVAAQSTQPLFPGSYCWDDPVQGLADVLFYYEQALQRYPIDPQRVIIAGISQGSGMAIHTALSGKVDLHGFLAVASWWAEPQSLIPQTQEAKSIRGYFIVGQKDHTLETTREIQKVLSESQILFSEEVHADLGHEYPSDFEKSFDKAIDFIFQEQE